MAHGTSDRCPGCRALVSGGRAQGHTEECRIRVEGEIRKTEEGKARLRAAASRVGDAPTGRALKRVRFAADRVGDDPTRSTGKSPTTSESLPTVRLPTSHHHHANRLHATRNILIVGGLVRTTKAVVEENVLGCRDAGPRLMAWMVHHAAQVICACVVGADGLTPVRRLKWRKFRSPLAGFGERVWLTGPCSGKSKQVQSEIVGDDAEAPEGTSAPTPSNLPADAASSNSLPAPGPSASATESLDQVMSEGGVVHLTQRSG